MLRLVVHNEVINEPKGTNMISSYSEASYFDGYAFQHIAAWQEEQRLKRARKEAAKAFDRRRNGRFMYRLTR